jgi:hypothetical protein
MGLHFGRIQPSSAYDFINNANIMNIKHIKIIMEKYDPTFEMI